MIGDPAYPEISVHRTAALEMSGLVATDPWANPASYPAVLRSPTRVMLGI